MVSMSTVPNVAFIGGGTMARAQIGGMTSKGHPGERDRHGCICPPVRARRVALFVGASLKAAPDVTGEPSPGA